MIETGRRVDCGHTQPGTKRDGRVVPLAGTACANENRVSEVADPEAATVDVRLMARSPRAGPQPFSAGSAATSAGTAGSSRGRFGHGYQTESRNTTR